jgi:hypothetical protein
MTFDCVQGVRYSNCTFPISRTGVLGASCLHIGRRGNFDVLKYRKLPTISPGLLFFCHAIFDGLIQAGAYIQGGGELIHGQSFVSVINKSVINRKINMY